MSPRTCQLPPGTMRIPPPQLSAKRVPNLYPPESGLAPKIRDESQTPSYFGNDVMPALSTSEAEPESEITGVERAARRPEVARRADLERVDHLGVGRNANQLSDEMRRPAGAILVVGAEEKPALRSNVRRISMAVKRPADQRQLLRVLEVEIRTPRRLMSYLGAGNGPRD